MGKPVGAKPADELHAALQGAQQRGEQIADRLLTGRGIAGLFRPTCGGSAFSGLITDALLGCQASRQQLHQIVGQAQEMSLRDLRLRAAGPGLCLLQLVFELIEDLFHLPAPLVDPSDQARRQVKLTGDKLHGQSVAALAGTGLITHAAHHHPLAGGDQVIRQHPGIQGDLGDGGY